MRTVSGKIRKTFTLSAENVALLREIEKERHADSTSAVLDDILLEKRRQRERARCDASIAAYYDSLSDQDMSENEAWGRMTESQFPLE